MDVKIYVAAHKDFHWPKDIIKDNSMYTIIDGGELQQSYPVPVMHEHTDKKDAHYVDLHGHYAEYGRLRTIYCYEKLNSGIVGFCQYKRLFNLTKKDIELYIKDHGIILPATVAQSSGIRRSYGIYHYDKIMDVMENIVKKNFPDYAKAFDDTMDAKALHAHNMFIMGLRDFRDFCFFMFKCYEELDRHYNWNTLQDVVDSGFTQMKIHGCLGERLSNVFYRRRFKDPKHIDILKN